MLRGTLAFLLLVAFAVAGTELARHLARRGIHGPAMEGLSFLVLGYALSERVLGLFPADVLGGLRAVVLLGLAWIGFVFGLEVDLRVIRRLRPWHRRLGLLLPTTLGLVMLVAAVVSGLPPVLACGLAAVATAPTVSPMEGLARVRMPTDRGARRLLLMIIGFSGLPALFVFHAATVLWSPVSTLGGGPVTPWQLLVAALGLGLVAGYALVALARGVRDSIPLLTLVAGVMAVVAGATAVLGLSPMPAAALGGAVAVNRSVFPHRLLKVAHALERPMLLALLVLVGASWRGLAFSWPVFVLMAPGRLLTVLAMGRWLGASAGRNGAPIAVAGVGLGLLPQGELAIGLLVALLGVAGGTDGVLEAVLLALVVNQLIGQRWLRSHLFVEAADPAESR